MTGTPKKPKKAGKVKAAAPTSRTEELARLLTEQAASLYESYDDAEKAMYDAMDQEIKDGFSGKAAWDETEVTIEREAAAAFTGDESWIDTHERAKLLESIKDKMPLEAQAVFQYMLDQDKDGRSFKNLSEIITDFARQQKYYFEDWVRPYKAIEKFTQALNCATKLKELLNGLGAIEYYVQIMPASNRPNLDLGSEGWILPKELDSLTESLSHVCRFIDSHRVVINAFLDTCGTRYRYLISLLIFKLQLDPRLDQIDHELDFRHALDIARAIYHEFEGAPPPLDWEKPFVTKWEQGTLNVEAIDQFARNLASGLAFDERMSDKLHDYIT